MTLPAITTNYRNKVLHTHFKKNYNILSQALVFTVEELGEGLHNRYINEPPGGASEFKEVYYKHLKRIGGLGIHRYTSKPYNFNSTSSSNLLGLGMGIGEFMLADGTAISVLKNNGNLNILVDVNGKTKPNRVGYDIFLFIVDNKKDKLVSWKSGAYENYCSRTSNSDYNGRSCTHFALIDQSPDDKNLGYFEALKY